MVVSYKLNYNWGAPRCRKAWFLKSSHQNAGVQLELFPSTKKLGTWWDLSQKMVGFTRWGIKNTKLLDDWCSPALSQETWGYWYLVGGWAYPLKTDGLRQLGWWHSQLNGKVIKFMFQTTSQILLTNKQWLVDGFSWLILWVKTQPDFSLRISWEYGMEPRAIAAIPSCNQTWQWKSADFKMMFPLRAPFVGFHLLRGWLPKGTMWAPKRYKLVYKPH